MDNKINTFLEFAESLKLVRKAEPEKDGANVIDRIYTDLLPNNGIISKVNLRRTTILVGRKGTGKSTIFQKSQKHLDSNKSNLTLYIDTKSLYDNSIPKLAPEIESTFTAKEYKKYWVYSNFIREIILLTKQKLKIRLDHNYAIKTLRLSEHLLGYTYLLLDDIEESTENVFKQINADLSQSLRIRKDSKTGSTDEIGFSSTIENPLAISAKKGTTIEESLFKEFENTFITYLDIKKCLIDNLIQIRDILKIRTLFIYLDDFSELNKEAQELLIDWFIAPLNNLSDDFVKFKIATYPKRFYYGKLDNSKIDEIPLDFFDAYYSFDQRKANNHLSRMEHLALDYTKRLITNRADLYLKDYDWSDFFEIDLDNICQILFKTTLNNPRKIGYILSYCFESCLIHDHQIGISAIESAAQRYYEDVIEKYFLVNEYVIKPFNDRISNDHQYDLLQKVIERQISNIAVIDNQREMKFDSHFYISNENAYLLDNLELNGFVSTYNKIRNKNNSFYTLFSLDYGLCIKFRLRFGNSCIEEGDSLPIILNFNGLLIDFFNSTQVIRCETGHEFPFSNLHNFKVFSMNCPTCMEDNLIRKCSIHTKFQDIKEKFLKREQKSSIQLKFRDYLVLNFLKISANAVSYSRLSTHLDISISTAEQIASSLVEEELCEIDIDASIALKKELVRITKKGTRHIESIEKILFEVKKKKDQNK